jgi:hypothetical protein
MGRAARDHQAFDGSDGDDEDGHGGEKIDFGIHRYGPPESRMVRGGILPRRGEKRHAGFLGDRSGGKV